MELSITFRISLEADMAAETLALPDVSYLTFLIYGSEEGPLGGLPTECMKEKTLEHFACHNGINTDSHLPKSRHITHLQQALLLNLEALKAEGAPVRTSVNSAVRQPTLQEGGKSTAKELTKGGNSGRPGF